jgi:glycosyltransferase involved in cell wall biosynthesis
VNETGQPPAGQGNGFGMKRRVALVVHDFDPAFGQGRYCFELAGRLQGEFAFTVYAASFGAGAGELSVQAQRVSAWRRGALSTVLTFVPGAERRLRDDRPDLIHAQGLTCWNADVITAHVCNGARLRRLKDGPWRSRLFAGLVTPIERAFYRQRRARHLIAISEVVRREIVEEYGWQRPATVIHHGTDVDRFRPSVDEAEMRALRSEAKVPAGAWTWLFMGEAVKGLGQVIRQLPQFPDAHLLIVSRSEMTPYRALAEQLGALDRVIFHGFDPRPERLHRAADVFVYPSDYDTFGMVATEAMASGVPVILGRDIGAAELVRDGANGLLCDLAQPATLTVALRQLAGDPALARRLGATARETVQQHTWDHCAAATARVYEHVLREKSAR